MLSFKRSYAGFKFEEVEGVTRLFTRLKIVKHSSCGFRVLVLDEWGDTKIFNVKSSGEGYFVYVDGNDEFFWKWWIDVPLEVGSVIRFFRQIRLKGSNVSYVSVDAEVIDIDDVDVPFSDGVRRGLCVVGVAKGFPGTVLETEDKFVRWYDAETGILLKEDRTRLFRGKAFRNIVFYPREGGEVRYSLEKISVKTRLVAFDVFPPRRFVKPWARPPRVYTPITLLLDKVLPSLVLAFLWLVLEMRFGILVLGGDYRDRLALINSLCGFIGASENVVIICDDVGEFYVGDRSASVYIRSFRNDPWVTERNFWLSEGMRNWADYVVLNEIRGDEGKGWLLALSLGLGGLSAMDAASLEEAVERLLESGADEQLLSRLKVTVSLASPRRFRFRKSIRVGEVVEVVSGARAFRRLFKREELEAGSYGLRVFASSSVFKSFARVQGWDAVVRELSLRKEFLEHALERRRKGGLSKVEDQLGLIRHFYEWKENRFSL